jgi:hypothetical protein
MASLAETLRQAGYVTPQGVTGPNAPLARQLKNYVTNVIPTAAQNLAQQRSDIDASLTMGDQGIQVGDREAFERQMAQVPNLMGLTAYHGTPHTIKGKFDISKVGTGEGAQAYGHGMYFAENPAVAKQYATDRSYVGKVMAGTPDNTPWDAQRIAQDTLNVHGDNAIAQLEKTLKNNSFLKNPQQVENNKQLQDAIDLLKTNQLQPVGNLYKVDIPDADIPMMLDWGKPLAQQTPEVQAAIQKLGDRFRPLDDMEAKNVTGERLYRRIENSFGKYYGNQANPDASALLNSVGIKGIRYLDEGSRVAEKGTSNYVVFDPTDVKILEQNSKPLTRKEILEQELKKVVE